NLLMLSIELCYVYSHVGSARKNGSSGSDGVSEIHVVQPKWIDDKPCERIRIMHTSNDYMVRFLLACIWSESGNTIGDTGKSQMSSSSVSPQTYNKRLSTIGSGITFSLGTRKNEAAKKLSKTRLATKLNHQFRNLINFFSSSCRVRPPVYGDLLHAPRSKKNTSLSLQFTFLGPWQYVNTVKEKMK
ncbi:hypothetical protein Tco_0852555, partial [Tanacetum coccineum]